MDINTVVGSVIGSVIVSSGTVAGIARFMRDRWMERVKAQYGTDLESFKSSLTSEQNRLQARIDRSVFVSRAQFDTEFNAMKDIFRFLTETRLSMEPIRPMFGYSNAKETDEDKFKRLSSQVADLVEHFNELSSQMEALSPFYPRELYEKLVECRVIAARDILQLRTAGESTFSPMWYVEGSTNQEEFQGAYHNAAAIIRDRLDRLSVVTG